MENHTKLVHDFINEAITKKALLVIMIDDFTNIHTKRRPTDETTSSARSMATILLKRFHDGSAIPSERSCIVAQGLSKDVLIEFMKEHLRDLTVTYASSMPYWIRTAFFDPEMEKNSN